MSRGIAFGGIPTAVPVLADGSAASYSCSRCGPYKRRNARCICEPRRELQWPGTVECGSCHEPLNPLAPGERHTVIEITGRSDTARQFIVASCLRRIIAAQ